MPVTLRTGLMKYKDPTTGQYVEMSALGDKLSDTIAPSYSDLTFPVASGRLCYHEGSLYISNQAIQTSEAWTAAHWDETTVEEVINEVDSRLNGALNAKSDLSNIAPDYADLTYPVGSGTPCIHDGQLYVANTDIQTSEAWTASHWTAVDVGSIAANALQNAMMASMIAQSKVGDV